MEMDLSQSQNWIFLSLRNKGFPALPYKGDLVLINLSAKSGNFIAYGKYNPVLRVLWFSIYLPIKVPKEKESNVLKYINYANTRTRIGHMIFDKNNHEVFFKIQGYRNQGDMPEDLPSFYFEKAIAIAERCFPGVALVISNDYSPEEAFELSSGLFEESTN